MDALEAENGIGADGSSAPPEVGQAEMQMKELGFGAGFHRA